MHTVAGASNNFHAQVFQVVYHQHLSYVHFWMQDLCQQVPDDPDFMSETITGGESCDQVRDLTTVFVVKDSVAFKTGEGLSGHELHQELLFVFTDIHWHQ